MDKHFTLKQLKISELSKVSKDIKDVLHKSKVNNERSLLSSVDINVALNYVFDCVKDDYVFDMDYMYEIQKILNSDFTPKWKSMHPATALTAALGMAEVREDTNGNNEIVVLIGEKAITSNIALDALKKIGELKKKIIIIINDNDEEKISHSSFNSMITKFRYSKTYVNLKNSVRNTLNANVIGAKTLNTLRSMKDNVKNFIISDTLFKEFDIDYLGPVDGHNIEELVKAFRMAKSKQNPIVLHVVTNKPHLVINRDSNFKYTNEIVLKWLAETVNSNKDIYFVKTDFPQSGMYDGLETSFGERYYNYGYSYSSALIFASGLASKNNRTFVLLPSVAVQRCYDQINDLISRNNLPITILINDAGLIGDKSDDFGVYDVSLLNTLSNVVVAQPANGHEMIRLLNTSLSYDRPMAIRYPLIVIRDENFSTNEKYDDYHWDITGDLNKADAVVITYGHYVDRVIEKANKNDFNISVINARFIKPIDYDLLDKLAELNKPVFVYTTDINVGGLGQEIVNYYSKENKSVSLYNFALETSYDSGINYVDLKRRHGIDINSLFEEIDTCLKK